MKGARVETPAEEVRTFLEPVELRSEGRKRIAFGYAAVWDRLSQDLGGFVEKVAKGAFAKTIKERDILGLFNHNADFVLGRTSSGTLRLWEDSTGLAYEIDVPDTTAGRDVLTLLERGDIRGSSFGFRAVRDRWEGDGRSANVRTVLEAALRDVGPVTQPAYLDSEAAVRAMQNRQRSDSGGRVFSAGGPTPISYLYAGREAKPKKDTIRPGGSWWLY